MKDDTRQVETVLSKLDIHLQWENHYRTEENRRFFDRAFDHLVEALGSPRNGRFLDVGCGICDHSFRLAQRGFDVHGTDLSRSILALARENIQRNAWEDRVNISCGNVLQLPFRDGAYDYILCWGVLMHIPDLEAALKELARVLAPGGKLAIAENNMRSLQSLLQRTVRRLRGNATSTEKRTVAGMEYWTETPAGALVSRQIDTGWLIDRLAQENLRLRHHHAGQFAELYTKTRNRSIQWAIHRFNHLWFRHVGNPEPAFGNLLVFEKE